MSFVAAAPIAEAATGAAARGAGAEAASAAGKSTAKSAARAPRKVRTAPDRARELARSGASRDQAARTLSSEYGSTLAESKGLLDDQAPPPAPADQAPAAGGSSGSSAPSFSAPKSVSSAASAGGGAILATLTYVLFLTYLRGGAAGVKAWANAKFLNRTLTSTIAPATAGSSGASGTNGTGSVGQGAGAGTVGGW